MTDRVEITPDNTNVSLEEQAKQQDEIVNADASTGEQVKAEETRPEWLPEKFKSAEDLAKAYSELEKKASSQTNKQEEPQQEQSNSLESFYSEYAETGSLTDKSYADLAKMGLDKNLVDGYIAGQKAIADAEVANIHNSVGGQENYSKIVDWAKSNLNEAEVEAFNATLDNGSVEQVKFAVQAIASRAGITAEPKQEMLKGDTISVGSDVFQSVAQVTEAISNPKYDKDPAYRKQVEEKLARSSIF